MKPTLFFLYFLISSALVNQTYAQGSLEDELAVLDAELDAIFANETDSLSLLALVDSLLAIDTEYSEIQFRISYSSRVTSAGRDFGIDQQGLAPGISYYHKSGIFTDISGFWSSELDPKYNLSIFTAGYLGRLNKRTTYGLTYDHSFYTQQDDYNTLTNSISASSTVSFKYVYTGLDYSFSFGTETAHRIIWNVTGNLSVNGFGPFYKISFLPSIALLFGNQNITNQYVNVTNLDRFENMNYRQLRQFSMHHNLSRSEMQILFETQNRLREGSATEEQLTNLESYFSTFESAETFDLLNYYFALPIVFYNRNFTLYFSYNYNIPRNLSDDITYEPNGYFGFAVAYNLRVK